MEEAGNSEVEWLGTNWVELLSLDEPILVVVIGAEKANEEELKQPPFPPFVLLPTVVRRENL